MFHLLGHLVREGFAWVGIACLYLRFWSKLALATPQGINVRNWLEADLTRTVMWVFAIFWAFFLVRFCNAITIATAGSTRLSLSWAIFGVVIAASFDRYYDIQGLLFNRPRRPPGALSPAFKDRTRTRVIEGREHKDEGKGDDK